MSIIRSEKGSKTGAEEEISEPRSVTGEIESGLVVMVRGLGHDRMASSSMRVRVEALGEGIVALQMPLEM